MGHACDRLLWKFSQQFIDITNMDEYFYETQFSQSTSPSIVSSVEIVDAINDEGGESKRGKIADGCFVCSRVFYDFGAKT